MKTRRSSSFCTLNPMHSLCAVLLALTLDVRSDFQSGGHDAYKQSVVRLAASQSIPFNAAPTPALFNPDRGFYKMYDVSVGSGGVFWSGAGVQWRSDASNPVSLVLLKLNLECCTNAALTPANLEFIANNLKSIRSAGLRAIVRLAYTNQLPTNGQLAVDVSPAVVQTHLSQLTTYFALYKDVIALVQHGIMGPWGEEHSSFYYGPDPVSIFTDPSLAAYGKIRQNLTASVVRALPPTMPLSFRRPFTKKYIYSSTSTPVPIGFHNDCFLASDSDMGTFPTAAEKNYFAANSLGVPVGGETCQLNAPRTDCVTAQKELELFHYSYLNIEWNDQVIQAWKTQGCFNSIRDRLGYRWVLKTGSSLTYTKATRKLKVTLSVQNTGFSACYLQKRVKVILVAAGTAPISFDVSRDINPRTWVPGTVVASSATIDLKAVASRAYDVYLEIIDPALSPGDSSAPFYRSVFANLSPPSAGSMLNQRVNLLLKALRV